MVRAVALVLAMQFPSSVVLSQQLAASPMPMTTNATVERSASNTSAKEALLLQDGTPVMLLLKQNLSSGDAKVGQEIPFEVAEDIEVGGYTVVRKGTIATGVVTEAVQKKRMGRAGRLDFSIKSITLADEEKAAVRSVSGTTGDSHAQGMVALMVSTPLVTAPFWLLMHGENTAIPKGTVITAFIDGDTRLDLAKFGAAPQPPTVSGSSVVSLIIDSIPSGAEVELDGTPAGKTPCTVSTLLGKHEVLIKKKGYGTWVKAVEASGSAAHVNALLEQSASQ